MDGLYDKLGEYVNLDELNYLASKLDEFSQSEYERFQAAMSVGDHGGSLQDMINLTENLDCYEVNPNITDYDDLGRYYINELDVMQIPDYLENYIDYEAYGRDVALDEYGQFTDYGYVRDTGDSFVEFYDGNPENIPEEYRVMTFQDAKELTEEEIYDRARENFGGIMAFAGNGGTDKLIGVSDYDETISADEEPEFDDYTEE